MHTVFWLVIAIGNHEGYNTLAATTVPQAYATEADCSQAGSKITASADSARSNRSNGETYVWTYCVQQSAPAKGGE